MSNEIDTAFDNKKIVINWDGGSQGGAGMAVCNGTHIQYAIPDSEDNLTLLTSNLATYQATHQIADLNFWTVTNVASQFPKSMSDKFIVKKFLSVIVLGGYNYVFWTNPDGDYMALRCRPDMLTQIDVSTIDLSVTSGFSLISNLATFVMPDTLKSLKGKIGWVVLAENQTGFLLNGTLDPNGFSPNSTWIANIDLSGSNFPYLFDNTFNGEKVNFDKYQDINAGWIDQGSIQIDKSQMPQPFISLIVSLHTEASGIPSCFSYGMDLLQGFDLDYNEKLNNGIYQGHITPVPITGLEAADSGGAVISTTPEGSLQINFIDSKQKLRIGKLFLNTSASSSPDYGKPGLYTPKWETYKNDPDGSNPNISAHNTPCSVFLPLPPTIGPSPYPVTPEGGGDPIIYQNCPSQGYVQCLFSSSSGNVPEMSTFYWGEIFGIPNYMIAPVQNGYEQTLLLTLVADTFPFPVPAKSVWGPDSPSGMINWLLCDYEYLVGDETEVDLEWNMSAAVGFKAEDVFEVAGIGVEGETSNHVGFSSLVKNSNITRQATSYTVTTKGVPPVDQTVETLTISPDGALFGNTPATQVGIDVYMIRFREQTKENNKSALMPAIHPILDSTSTSITGDFKSYYCIPGNPASYLEDAINKRMSELFADTEINNNDFHINGEDFTKIYTEGKYLDNIVKRFGVNSFGTESNLPYLEFSFSETGIKRSEFQSTSSFTFGAGAFLDSSDYAGLAWDQTATATLGLLGCADISANLASHNGFAMIGVDFSSSLTTTNVSSSTWGVNLGEYLNPLGPGEAYTARMYFLQPSPLWARELQYFGQLNEPADIDLVNSSPIRILFTVSYISDALRLRLNSMDFVYPYNPGNTPPLIINQDGTVAAS